MSMVSYCLILSHKGMNAKQARKAHRRDGACKPYARHPDTEIKWVISHLSQAARMECKYRGHLRAGPGPLAKPGLIFYPRANDRTLPSGGSGD